MPYTDRYTYSFQPIKETLYYQNYQPWYQWNVQQKTTTASTQLAAYYTDQIWQGWATNVSTTITVPQYVTYANAAWDTWVKYQMPIPPPETAEQRQARIARQEQARLEAAARHKADQERRTAARARARSMLDSVLTAEQKAELETHGRFHVRGGKTGRRYCIRAEGQSGNVDLLNDDGTVQATFCAHPSYTHDRPGELVPEGDAWVAQMLEIELDEFNFLRQTNVPRGRIPQELIAASGRTRY